MSHHPPIAAAHCESDKYTYDIVSCPKTKFYGNSIDVFPYGITRIQCVCSPATWSPGEMQCAGVPGGADGSPLCGV